MFGHNLWITHRGCRENQDLQIAADFEELLAPVFENFFTAHFLILLQGIGYGLTGCLDGLHRVTVGPAVGFFDNFINNSKFHEII